MIVVASYIGFIGFQNSAFPSIVRFLMKLSSAVEESACMRVGDNKTH